MATEFKRAEKDLEQATALLDRLSATSSDLITVSKADMDELRAVATRLVQDAATFEKRRLETVLVEDPNVEGGQKEVPKYYGPKMAEKVLAFETQVGRFQERFKRFEASANVVEPDISSVVETKEDQPQAMIASSTGLQVVRESEADLARKRLEEERHNAKLALEAVERVAEQIRQTDADDPLTNEKRLFEQIPFSPGVDGFKNAIMHVDVNSLKNIAAILEVVTKHPENVQYRTLTFANASVRELLQSAAVKESLASLGFRPQYVTDSKTQEQSVAYFLREPSVETDFDAWSTWFDTLKAALEVSKMSLK